MDDADRYHTYRRILAGELDYEALSAADQAFARMLLFSVWPNLPFASYREALAALHEERAFRFEVIEVLDQVWSRVDHEARHLPADGVAFSPLRSHARYTREELLSALEHSSIARPPSNFREGVVWSEPLRTDAFLITLRKDEAQFSPTTMYRDYAISPDHFHWESQSDTSLESATGKRYINQLELGTNVILFTRLTGSSEFGKGAPYICLGTARYLSHKGERPIAITYRLDRPMPADVFQQASVDVG